MTYIRKRCRNCGYTHSASVYGYVQDPVGIPASSCPQCGSLYKESGVREWIQMSGFKKYFSIYPRGIYMAFFPGIFLSMPVIFLLIFITKSEAMILPGFLIGMALTHYLFTCLRLGSESFRKSYCDSILRTRNPRYLEFLKSQGRLTDESIPRWVLCSKGARRKIDEYLSANAWVSNSVRIPTFAESIRNSR